MVPSIRQPSIVYISAGTYVISNITSVGRRLVHPSIPIRALISTRSTSFRSSPIRPTGQTIQYRTPHGDSRCRRIPISLLRFWPRQVPISLMFRHSHPDEIPPSCETSLQQDWIPLEPLREFMFVYDIP